MKDTTDKANNEKDGTTNKGEEGGTTNNENRVTYFDAANIVTSFLRRAPSVAPEIVDFSARRHMDCRADAFTCMCGLCVPSKTVAI